ncbi:PLP-dependent transferase [Clavulina sp. PMI_390]|nr:PLP-dependent transferase [Clavulina sp. PMI_390]
MSNESSHGVNIPLPPSSSPPWESKTSEQKYWAMGSWFVGPRGENGELLKERFNEVVNQIVQGRKDYFPKDTDSIKKFIQNSDDFKDEKVKLQTILKSLSGLLAKHSVPFYSPRYAGHMSFDISLPAMVGYLTAMQYNQNNVTPEASPFTSFIEWDVGQRLCHMFGYNTRFNVEQQKKGDVQGWGHITAGGSVANLESMWYVLSYSRNLKYYPLALRNAITKKPNPPLAFVADTFEVTLCTGKKKNFVACTSWELLNLTPTEVADIPDRLMEQFGMSKTALEKVLEDYSIQTVGKQQLDSDFGITKPPGYLISGANHYSWPKAAAVTGIGREHVIELMVDDDARLKLSDLEEKLNNHLADSRALYAVVAIVGTTEHGSVDPVEEIYELRNKMQAKGLSFMIHADAAWGGFFASKKRPHVLKAPREEYAFSIPLKPYVNDQMLALRLVDSITMDPHKSGYIPYPAGGLCYRDGRHRSLTTWSSPYINVDQSSDFSMGIYGIEGSKPGAAPVAVWLSHEVMGVQGYDNLLGTAMLTGVKMYAHWATMTIEEDQPLVVTPFNRLPTERDKESPEEILKQRREIRRLIVERLNHEIEHDLDAMTLIHKIGSDLMINAFACNFRIGKKVNSDVVEASFLNRRLYQRLSITKKEDDIQERPIILMGTEFTVKRYGDVLKRYKERIGLVGDENLFALSNTSMSPWATTGQFLQTITNAFKDVAYEEIKTCLVRVEIRPSIHSFIVHNVDKLYLSYLPMFNVANQQRQLIITGLPDEASLAKLRSMQVANASSVITFHTKSIETLDELLKKKTIVGDVYEGFPSDYGSASISTPIFSNVEISMVSILRNTSLHRNNIDKVYPARMPFHVFGKLEDAYIEHTLLRAPNVQLSASGAKLELNGSVDYSRPLFAVLDKQHEALQQPFNVHHPPSFFACGESLDVSVYYGNDATGSPTEKPIATGKLTLPASPNRLFVDFTHLNEEAAADIYVMASSDAEKEATKDDLTTAARRIVQLFKAGDIVWTDNVVNSIYKKYPQAKQYQVSLGVPEGGLNNCEHVVLSRFLGRAGAESETGAMLKMFTEAANL